MSGFILQVWECSYLDSIGVHGIGIKLSSFVYSAGVIMVAFSSKVERCFNGFRYMAPLAYVGGASFGIYLLHVVVLQLMSRLVPLTGWYFSWVSALLLSIAVISVCRRVHPRAAERFLGFR